MITLDIEDTCLRLLVVERGKIEKAASSALEPGLVADGVILDKTAVSQRIRNLMQTNRISGTQVAVCISGIHSMYRVVRMPHLPQKVITDAARQEIARAMPMAIEELYTAWQTVTLSDVEMALCLVGTPRDSIDALIDTLKQAGLKPHSIDIKPLVMARLTDSDDAICINVRPESYDIVIMLDGIPEIVRSLSFPQKDVSPVDRVNSIVEELNRTITYYNSSHKNNQIAETMPVFLSGDLRDILANQISRSIRQLPELYGNPAGVDSNEFAASMGLALKVAKERGSQSLVYLNIIPETLLPKPKPVAVVLNWALIIIGIGVLVLLAMTTYSAVQQTSALKSQVEVAQVQVKVKQSLKQTVDKLQNDLKVVEAERDSLNQLLGSLGTQQDKVTTDLGKVTSLLPGIIDLTSVSYGKDIEIVGKAPDQLTILGYARALRDTNRFNQVVVASMQQIKYNQWDFTLSLK